MAGSNDLNMLLKSQVIKLRAELDVKGSMSKIREQIGEISRKLENKPVKLKVKLDATVADLNGQMRELTRKIENSKTIRKPSIKLRVDIDTKGSATQIKNQLKEIHNEVDKFNSKYRKQIGEISNTANKNANIGSFGYSNYVNQIKEAEAEMRRIFGKSGNFTSFQTKDAQGNLQGFIAQLEKANGVVQKIRYQWDKEAGSFMPINQTTVDGIEKHVNRASQSLRGLYADIERLNRSQGQSNLFKQYEDLEGRIGRGTLTQDAVKELQRQIREEQTLQQVISKQNQEYITQQKLIDRINGIKKSMNSQTYREQVDIDSYKELDRVLKRVKDNDAPDELARMSLEVDRINNSYKERIGTQKQLLSNEDKRVRVLRDIQKLEQSTVFNDVLSKGNRELVEEIKLLTRRAKVQEDWFKVNQKMNKLRISNAEDKSLQSMFDMSVKGEEALKRLTSMGRLSTEQIDRYYKRLNDSMLSTEADMKRVIDDINRDILRIRNQEKDLTGTYRTLLSPNSADGSQMRTLRELQNAVNIGDAEAIKRYIGNIYGAEVAQVKMTQTTDALGRAVDRLNVKMAGKGKTVKAYTVDLDKYNRELRESATGLDYNANRNLGVMEQLRIAMARVPTWMTAMTAFYGTIRSIRAMSREILEIDKSMTNIRRVASDNVNIGAMFEGAVDMSAELGNNIHDILGSLEEFSRTFGEFSERQLLAITRTATLMSNVSDLTAQEATESLVGTMNAFNITAEESIRIVDSLNEVDNNYAISTKQLAEGLNKSASTAQTFGATMEQVVGHITAIGSVTMESGKQIGNGLKTIYSRITTMGGAENALREIGIGISRIGINGEEMVRPVNDILEELAGKWHELSDAERQNVAIKVAGRYQLTRFLALMNNYKTASDATQTAVTSHGSAMRENAEYMKSFEARINQLKNAFTDMSLAIGDAVLSDGILLIIEGLKDMAQFASQVADTVGALPPVFLALFLVANKMGVFNKLKKDILDAVAGITTYRVAMTKATADGATKLGAIQAGWRAITTAEAGASAGARAFGLALKSALISTGIGAVIVALGFGIEKLVSHFAEARREAEELEKMNKKVVSSYREMGREDGVNRLIGRYEELSKKANLTTEEQQELSQITTELANKFPTMVDYIDAQGQAHLKTTDAMREQTEMAKELSLAQADLSMATLNEDMAKAQKEYEKTTKELEKLEKAMRKLEEANGEEIAIPQYGADPMMYTVDNDEDIAKKEMERIRLEAQRSEHIQNTITLIQQASISYMEQEGKLSSLGDEQQKIIENYIALNHETLRSANNSEEAQYKLYQLGTAVGNVFADARKEMTDAVEGMDLTPAEEMQEIDKIGEKFDQIAQAIPEDMFKLDEDGNIQNTVEDLQDIVDIASKIDSNTSFAVLKQDLIEAGMEADQAGFFIAELARVQENSALQSQAQAEGFEEVADGAEEMTDKIAEALDLTKEMLGYSNADFSAIESYLQYMDLLVARHGDAIKSSEEYKGAQQLVADTLGVTAEEVEKNQHRYELIVAEMQKVDFSTYQDTQTWDEWVDSIEDVSGTTRDYLRTIEFGKDVITQQKDETEELTDATDSQTEANKDLANSEEEVKKKTEELKTKFQETKDDMNETNRAEWLDTIRTQIDEIGQSIVITKDDAGKFKFAMADGSESEYLNELQSQLDDLGYNIEVTKEKNGKLKLSFNDGEESETLLRFQGDLENTNIKIDETKVNMDELSEAEVAPTVDVDFVTMNEGLDEVKVTLDDLQGAFDSLEENIKKLLDIELIIIGLKEMASDLMDAIKGLFDSNEGGFDDLEDKARNAENAVKDLKKAVENVKNLASRIEHGGFIDLRDACVNAIEVIERFGDRLRDMPIKDSKDSLDGLGSTFDNLRDDVDNAYDDMNNKIRSRTNSMISKHDSHKSSIDNLADSARSAKSAISDMVYSANNAMDDLNRYIARANRATSAGRSVPSTPRSGGFLSGLFSGFSAPQDYTPSDSVSSAMSTFSASAEGLSSSSGGADGGTSGSIQPSIYSGGMSSDGSYMFSALADLADAYDVNQNERQMTIYGGIISQLETRMDRIAKNTVKYRDALKDVIYYQNLNLKLVRKELADTEKRNRYIDSRLNKLSNISKHSESQREEYNELQREYDSNLSKIASLKSEIESTINDVQSKSLDFFNDFVDEIIENYDKSMKSIRDKVENIDFKLNVLEISGQGDLGDEINLVVEKVVALTKEHKYLEGLQKELNKQLNTATKQYGKNSKEVKRLKDELDNVYDSINDINLEILRSEKQIKDVRGEVADDSINMLKKYYGEVSKLLQDAISKEKEILQDSHDEKMSMYDEEIDKINSAYKERISKMDEEKSETEHQAKLEEKNAEKAELLNKIRLLSMNNSLEGKKKLADAELQLATLQEEIDRINAERKDQLLRQELEKQKQQQIQAIELQRQQEETELEQKIDRLEQEKEAINQYYSDLIENDRYWSEMRNQFIEGNFTIIGDEMAKMKTVLSDLDNGVFESLTGGFTKLSDTVKNEISDINKILIDNLNFEADTVADKINDLQESLRLEVEKAKAERKKAEKVSTPKKTSSSKSSGGSSKGSSSKSSSSSSSKKSNPIEDLPLVRKKYATPRGGWNHPPSVVDYLKMNDYKADFSNRKDLYNALNGSGSYKGTQKQNDWLLKKLEIIGLRTGGYTGDGEGLAYLHEKEQVFNKDDTANLLDASKILRKIKDVLPVMSKSNTLDKVKDLSGAGVVNNYELTLNIDRLNSNKEDANFVAKEIMKGLKKVGK